MHAPTISISIFNPPTPNHSYDFRYLSQLVIAKVTVAIEAYPRAVQWLCDVFCRSVFEGKRVGISRYPTSFSRYSRVPENPGALIISNR